MTLVYDKIPRLLYEHPIVEYIPLEATTLVTGSLPAEVGLRPGGLRPVLHALDTPKAWRAATVAYPFAFPPLPDLPPIDRPLRDRRDLTLLALGFRVAAGIYRGRKVSLVTSTVGPVYHLFNLPLKYFYKPSIDFVTYTSLGALVAETRAVEIGTRPRGNLGPGMET